jgi:Protein of unknown function (DUF3775)
MCSQVAQSSLMWVKAATIERNDIPGQHSSSKERSAMATPEIDRAKACFIALKARELDAQEDVVEPDYGSNATDDGFVQILEAYEDDPTFIELKAAIDNLNWDEQCVLVALTWVGRGDFEADGWDEALQLAQDQHTEHTALYLIGIPLLSDYVENGLSTFGMTCDDIEIDHL